MVYPKDLYVITTAMKRDSLDWVRECSTFCLSLDRESSINKVKVTIDSWNNIGKYLIVKDAFFIFDEQRIVGSGAWVKYFIKITRSNNWVLLSATPGDTWMDYVPVFIANGFYKNRTEFCRRHIKYSNFTKYPKIERYLEQGVLAEHKEAVTVIMEYVRPTTVHHENITVPFNKELITKASIKRWNPYEDRPIKDVSELCFVMRKIVNSDPHRLSVLDFLLLTHDRMIIFYTFNYELDILRKFSEGFDGGCAEWNGHKHEPLPTTKKWLYLVQYTAGAEGWNCVDTNVVVFYSQSYSYKATIQAAGRIDRLNTCYSDLYYYHIYSKAPIDLAIQKALKNKKNFNENRFISS